MTIDLPTGSVVDRRRRLGDINSDDPFVLFTLYKSLFYSEKFSTSFFFLVPLRFDLFRIILRTFLLLLFSCSATHLYIYINFTSNLKGKTREWISFLFIISSKANSLCRQRLPKHTAHRRVRAYTSKPFETYFQDLRAYLLRII